MDYSCKNPKLEASATLFKPDGLLYAPILRKFGQISTLIVNHL